MAVNDVRHQTGRRVGIYANIALFALGVALTAFSLTSLAHRDGWRMRLDATKTRAYSLSEQTSQMLASLDGSWRIVVMMVESEADRTVRKQVDEVLHRFEAAAPDLTVARIDPTDPAALDEYEEVLSDLRGIYAKEIRDYDTSLGRARASFNEWLRFVGNEATTIQNLSNRLPAQMPIRAQIERLLPFFTLMARDGGRILDRVDSALDVSDIQPLPDYETARSILVAALTESAQNLNALASVLTALRSVPSIDRTLSTDADAARQRYESMSISMAEAADPLRHLPPLELSRIGEEMQRGETAIVISPRGAAIVPSNQLFPKANIRAASAGVSFDQRFRGEQVIAASVRSLLVERMPKVVFVHAMSQSLLRETEGRFDLFGAKTLLEGARIEVGEWIIGQGERPSAAPGQSIVWVVVPSVNVSQNAAPVETVMLGAVNRLLNEGESVLLSYYPSIMHNVRQPDPWQRLVRPWGLNADTSRAVYESVLTQGGARQQTRQVDVRSFNEDHPIGRAVDGLQTRFGIALPIQFAEDVAPTGLERTVLATIAPAPNRWLEPEWASGQSVKEPEAGDARLFTEPVPFVVAASRPNPQDASTRQRLIVVGSGNWMLSQFIDFAVNIGGNRMALVSPGNIELLQSSIYWLAGMDELIAQSPTGQQVARLEDITQSDRLRWGVILILILPFACLILGSVVFVVRRF